MKSVIFILLYYRMDRHLVMLSKPLSLIEDMMELIVYCSHKEMDTRLEENPK